MAVRPDHERGATVDEVTHRHLLGGRLAVEIDDDGLDVRKRMRGDCNLDRGEGIVEQRSEEHTSELQSHSDLVCRLLLEKKKKKKNNMIILGIVYEPRYINMRLKQLYLVGLHVLT